MPDRLELVAGGHRPGAILNTDDVDAAMARAALAGLTAVVGDPIAEDPRGRLTASPHPALVYVARTSAAAEHLRDLDRRLHHTSRPEVPRESHALGTALGYPECCAWAYPHTAFERPGEGEDVRWARNFAWRAGPGRHGPWSPWLNFHAARVFGLDFFEHLPCCPWCRPTRERNQTLVDALYAPPDAFRIRDALSQSVVLWPDGSFLPFLCTGAEDGVLGIAEAGVPRGELRPHCTDRVRSGIDGHTAPSDALRRGRHGWEARIRGRWAELAPRDLDPIVLAFR